MTRRALLCAAGQLIGEGACCTANHEVRQAKCQADPILDRMLELGIESADAGLQGRFVKQFREADKAQRMACFEHVCESQR